MMPPEEEAMEQPSGTNRADAGQGQAKGPVPPTPEHDLLHPSLAAALRNPEANREGAARLEKLLSDPAALTATLQAAVAAAIDRHHAAGQPVYYSKSGVIYEEDAAGIVRPYDKESHERPDQAGQLAQR
jgi:hypothetical protein